PPPTVPQPAPEVIAPPKLEVVAPAKPEVIAETKPAVIAETKPETIAAPQPEVVAAAKPAVIAEEIADPDPDVLLELEPEPDEPAPELSPLVVETVDPPMPANDRSRTSVVTVPPRNRSRLMAVAGIVAAVVLLADVAMVVVHRRNVAQRA